MKYLKLFENINEDKDLLPTLEHLIRDIFKNGPYQNKISTKIENWSENSKDKFIELQFGIRFSEDYLGVFFKCYFFVNSFFNKIKISSQYSYDDIWTETTELEKYLNMIFKKYSTYYDDEAFYYVDTKNIKNIISKLNIEEYTIIKNIKKYNL